MPWVSKSEYQAPFGMSNGHLQTILPALFRRVNNVSFSRKRFQTDDNDFLDVDCLLQNSSKLVILSHGLEGSTKSQYIRGMARYFFKNGFDVAAWNFRGCSGEINQTIKFYHSGSSNDLRSVIQHLGSLQQYSSLYLIGFSMGGNITLKYLGEPDVHPKVKSAVTFSVPCDLRSSSIKLAKWDNKVYMETFLRSLRSKVRAKMQMFPGELEDRGLDKIRTFAQFDNFYTAPLHGFSSAEDYWSKASSKPGLFLIPIPTLLVNAKNDPFLDKECFPIEIAQQSSRFFFEMPQSGGHVGFMSRGEVFWSERRALEFIQSSQ